MPRSIPPRNRQCPTNPERSRIMAAVRSTGNASTEKKMASAFRENGIRGWRRHFPIYLPKVESRGWLRSFVRPDFVFRAAKIAVFVDGDFWHGNAKRLRIPKSNREYWVAKITRNRIRDAEVDQRLRAKGWKVVRLWESSLKERPAQCLSRVRRALDPT